MMTTTCKYCGATFDPPRPTTALCRNCWYEGRSHTEARAALIEAVAGVPGVDRAEIQHTGGGCFGLAVVLRDGRVLFATDAYQDAQGAWFVEASLPEVGAPWGVGVYRDADAFGDGTTTEDFLCPLTDAGLVEAVRARATTA